MSKNNIGKRCEIEYSAIVPLEGLQGTIMAEKGDRYQVKLDEPLKRYKNFHNLPIFYPMKIHCKILN